jgi:uncharacterized protein (DUF427 family)
MFHHVSTTPFFTPPQPASSSMVKVIFSDTVVADSSETVFIEGNHYFPPEAIKVDLSISDTT